MQRPCFWRSQAGHWRPGERSRCDPTLTLTPGRPWRTLAAFLRRDLLERDSRRTQVSAGSARAMTSPGSNSGREGSAEPVARVLGALRHLAPCRRRPGRSGPKWPLRPDPGAVTAKCAEVTVFTVRLSTGIGASILSAREESNPTRDAGWNNGMGERGTHPRLGLRVTLISSMALAISSGQTLRV